ARSYEATSFRGLFRFLRFIERMEERGDDLGAARALSEQEDVVRIMTIHSSKGLEFPIVIFGGLAREFNFTDLRQKYLLHKDYGFASKYIDPIKRITYPTLFYHALQKEKLREILAEEMRVLYVGLTRAQEKLVMVGAVKDLDKEIEKWLECLDHSKWLLPTHLRAEAKTYLDWIGPALIRHENNDLLRRTQEIQSFIKDDIWRDETKWKISINHASALTEGDHNVNDLQADYIKDHITNWTPLSLDNQKLEQKVSKRLSYRYPFQEATQVRAKQTVTEIKRIHDMKDEYSSDQMIQPYRQRIVERPQFMQQEKTISAAEIGTAMHAVMQHLPFTKQLLSDEIKKYLETFVSREILTIEEKNIIDVEAIEQFFKTPIAKYMCQQTSIYREVPFSLSLPASDVYTSWMSQSDESVLIQGVIDCLIPKDDGWIILDYKTDDTEQKTKEELIERYNVQMNLYKRAVETILRQPVKDIYLYFFSGSLTLKIHHPQLTL